MIQRFWSRRFLVLACVQGAFAQSNNGEIAGAGPRAAGRVVPGATITVTSARHGSGAHGDHA